jgi:hypothetical protein
MTNANGISIVTNKAALERADGGTLTDIRSDAMLPRTFAELHALINRLVAEEDTHGSQR